MGSLTKKLVGKDEPNIVFMRESYNSIKFFFFFLIIFVFRISSNTVIHECAYNKTIITFIRGEHQVVNPREVVFPRPKSFGLTTFNGELL